MTVGGQGLGKLEAQFRFHWDHLQCEQQHTRIPGESRASRHPICSPAPLLPWGLACSCAFQLHVFALHATVC